MRSAFIGLALALGVRTAPVMGQNIPPWSAKVQVTIAGEDAVTGRVSSWFTEELRRMQGVEVVDSAPDWEIHIVVMQTQNQGRTVTGYALSEVVLSRFDQPLFFRGLAAADSVPAHRAVWQTIAPWALVVRDYEDHHLLVGPLDNLRAGVEGLAATFDTKQLEPSRKLWEKARSPRRPS
jgi:hypothetical protein